MSENCPYKLVRDALGFYNQVPVTADGGPEKVDVKSEDLPEIAPTKRAPTKCAPGRPKRAINADFEVAT